MKFKKRGIYEKICIRYPYRRDFVDRGILRSAGSGGADQSGRSGAVQLQNYTVVTAV